MTRLLAVDQGSTAEILRRALAKVLLDDTCECWVWIGAKDGKGYGHMNIGRRYRQAHLVVYECLVGEIASGHELDHLCRNRWCVSPAHMEPVTGRVNRLRSSSASARAYREQKCKRGHPYEGNRQRGATTRQNACRVCKREWLREWRKGRAPDASARG